LIALLIKNQSEYEEKGSWGRDERKVDVVKRYRRGRGKKRKGGKKEFT
jgi:hypothetical protein